jgi:prepilin-type N-terminal cleavage/methylation domain-containing protein
MRVTTIQSSASARDGFTLAEVLIALALLGIMLGGIINSYLAAAQRAEWASASAAAHRLAVMKLEQLKTAPWEDLIDLMSEGPKEVEGRLDLPVTVEPNQQATAATVRFWVEEVTPAEQDLVRLGVECVWSMGSRGYTNPVPPLVTYRGRD